MSTLPGNIDDQTIWGNRLLEATGQARAFRLALTEFSRRDSYDYRELRQTDDGPVRIDGAWPTTGPLRLRLAYGTDSELVRGLAFNDIVRPYSLMRLTDDQLPRTVRASRTIAFRSVTYDDPAADVLEALLHEAYIQPAERIFCTTGYVANPTECADAAVIAFPVGRTYTHDGLSGIVAKPVGWLLWVRGARYHSETAYLLAGDLDAWARDHKREPRSGRGQDFVLAFDHSVPDNDPAHPWKVLEHEPKMPKAPGFPPEPITLFDLEQAYDFLRTVEIEDGQPWFYGGGA